MEPPSPPLRYRKQRHAERKRATTPIVVERDVAERERGVGAGCCSERAAGGLPLASEKVCENLACCSFG